ncbi:uncharacterized protein [Branchiostoma lanceolatum]|uniref:uncharacterized protein n=1 Tax=Branchiostoma lanceolatum TaxID=7740 RepID=UPI003454EE35
MLRVCQKLREADAKGRRYGLARAETGYLRALVDAVADKDRLAEVELLKSLGDVNLEKGRLGKDVRKLNMALALYMAAVVRCQNKDQREGIEHRYEYTERLLQGVSSKGSQGKEQSTEDKATTPAKVAGKFQDLDKRRAASGNTDSVLVKYAQLMVDGIVNENNMLETEAIKSIVDVYLKRETETRDTRELTRATALYNTALARCHNVHGTVVIVHRLLYTAKIRQDITTANMKRSTRKQRQHHVTGRKDNFSAFSTVSSSDVINGGMRRTHIAPEPQKDENATWVDDDNIYEEQLQHGLKALQNGDLDIAEKSFAATLKSVHVKGQHKKEAEPLYKLGDVYLKRGIQSKDGGDFTKAAALCNAALVRSRRKDIEDKIQQITQSFVKEVLKIEQKVDIDDTEKHKLLLKADREYVEKEIKIFEQEIDPYSLDDNDPKIKDVEMKRAEAIKKLYETLVDHRKTFITSLVDECMDVMGPPPCKYAMIGLGSQATGLATPYSDLEFAILVEEETKQNVNYFRNLTHYLHLKVINLGETILPAMGIKSLNDFYSDDPLDSWYYDSVTPRGFAFDGAMPHACKTPMGRGRNSTGTNELIRTPSNMTNILKDDLTFHLKKGYHLASILGNVSFITGEQGLVNEYRSLWTQQLDANDERACTYLLMANTDMTDNAPMFQTQTLTASLLDVKKEIYRFSSLAVSWIALVHNIQLTTIWETILELKSRGVVNSENAHHLMVLVSISAELRLRTYINNRGQVENMSALSSMSTDMGIGAKLKKVFYISNTNQLFRYYYTERPLKIFISQLVDQQPLKEPPIFFDNSPKLKAKVYQSLCDFKNAKTCTEQTLQSYLSKHGENTAHSDVAASLNILGSAWIKLGDQRKAVSCYKQSLQMSRSIYGEDAEHPDIASSLHNLGNACFDLGNYAEAVSFHKQSLQMRQSIHDTAHPDIASSLLNLGNASKKNGDYRNAISYYEQSLQMRLLLYGEDTAHPDIANSLNNLGAAWSDLGDHRKVISYYEQSLQMNRSIYGEDTAYPDIAASLHNLGAAWNDLGHHRKAVSYCEQSLQMSRIIFGEDAEHPHIATSLDNLGNAWRDLGDQRKAFSYYEQSLQMSRSIYGEDTEHPDIANTLHNLGKAWGNCGDHKKAISYYEHSLQMRRSIYGEDTAHPDIAITLDNVGATWCNLGDHRKAASYHEQSLQMQQSFYGRDAAVPTIAVSLNNLGSALGIIGDYRKALSCHEQSLQMNLSIYGENTSHLVIYTSLTNVGIAWRGLGDHRKAASYHEQALQMARSIHGEDAEHLDIARSLANLYVAWRELGDHRTAIRYLELMKQMKQIIRTSDVIVPSL